MKNKAAQSIAAASVVLSSLSLFSKAIGLVREIIYADKFGLSADYDLFLASAALPLVLNIAVLYICQHFFIPAYKKIAKDSQEKGNEFFAIVFWVFTALSILFSAVLFVSAPSIINFYLHSLSHEMVSKGITIFNLLLLTIPLNMGIAVITVYMQANFRFIYPSVIQIILNSLVIIVILFFTDLLDIYVLPVSFVAANAAAYIILLKPAAKLLKLKIKTLDQSLISFSNFKIILFLVIIEGLSLSYVLVDRFFLNRVEQGGIAALSYAAIIFSVPVSIFSIPLITTTFSKFTDSFHNSIISLREDYEKALRINIYVILIFSFLLYFWGDLLLYIFYQRGEFKAEDTILTFEVLRYYILGLVFYSSYLVMVKLCYSMNNYLFIMLISIGAFILKIAANFLLVDYLKQDGLALSNSVVYLFLFGLGALKIQKALESSSGVYISYFIYIIINCAASYLVSMQITKLFSGDPILIGTAEPVFFIVIFMINSYLLKDNEFFIFKDITVKIISKIKNM